MVDCTQPIEAAACLLHNEFQRRAAQLEIIILEPSKVVGRRSSQRTSVGQPDVHTLDAVEKMEEKKIAAALMHDDEDTLTSIRDSGAGIPKWVAQRLFKPFFTIKPLGGRL
ncbi:MAG TPA: hypothetical protein VHK70_08335 [Burkholderiaceae bacterium]|nr:hypothetical protein [Burkholderiaceae bacterium]